MNVVATQSSSSDPVEVSWDPPSSGDDVITGYRIFYGNGKNVSVNPIITSVGLRVTTNFLGQTLFIRSETDGIYSELINVSVTTGKSNVL